MSLIYVSTIQKLSAVGFSGDFFVRDYCSHAYEHMGNLKKLDTDNKYSILRT